MERFKVDEEKKRVVRKGWVYLVKNGGKRIEKK